jgi:ribonuclease HII
MHVTSHSMIPMVLKELLYIVLYVATTETCAFIPIQILSMQVINDNQCPCTRNTLLTIVLTKSVMFPSRRRSPRLIALDTVIKANPDSSDKLELPKRSKKRDSTGELDVSLADFDNGKRPRRNASQSTKDIQTTELCSSDVSDRKSSSTKMSVKKHGKLVETLPRTVEESIRSQNPHVQYVLGIDEAGRGPLAGPVVVAAVCMAVDHPVVVEGVTDSKKITAEAQREILYKQLMESLCIHRSPSNSVGPPSPSEILWAIAVIDAETIDKINILQATLLGMELVASAIMEQAIEYPMVEYTAGSDFTHQSGCVVVVGRSNPPEEKPQHSGSKINETSTATESASSDSSTTTSPTPSKFYALIDGNRLPKNMPCPAKAMIKGDSREYCIAAASILAKVTRDRIMHRYHSQYPEYNFAQHKGYPTAAHVQAIRAHGPSPIHRMSFAPLKKPTKTSKK